jgi:hypothetical protein
VGLNRDYPVLSQRTLNRTSLSRQLLLHRSDMSITEAVAHLIAIQAQAHKSAYIGLWSRLQEFSVEKCDLMLTGKALIRSTLMRGTLHLSTADDALNLASLFSQQVERKLRSSFERELVGIDITEVARAAREILAGISLTNEELGLRLLTTWPGRSPMVLAQVARCTLELVQAPPLLWGSGERPKVTAKEEWLAKKAHRPTSVFDLIKRYLGAFGPASTADMQKWLGLTGLATILGERVDELRLFRSVSGQVLYDLPAHRHVDFDVEAPARLLSGFDATVLAYADRSRFVDEQHVPRLCTRNGIFHPVFLLDGRIAGLWNFEHSSKSRTVIRLSSFDIVTKADSELLAVEANNLARFMGYVAADLEIQVD